MAQIAAYGQYFEALRMCCEACETLDFFLKYRDAIKTDQYTKVGCPNKVS